MQEECDREVPKPDGVPDFRAVLVPEHPEERPAEMRVMVQHPIVSGQHAQRTAKTGERRKAANSLPPANDAEHVERDERIEPGLDVDREPRRNDERDFRVGEPERGHREHRIYRSGRAERPPALFCLARGLRRRNLGSFNCGPRREGSRFWRGARGRGGGGAEVRDEAGVPPTRATNVRREARKQASCDGSW